MPVTDALVDEVVAALTRDLMASGLERYLYIITAEATNARQLVDDAPRYVEKVVEDVQQSILDQFIDTSWPRCPRHFRHPLWFHNGVWLCEQDQVAVARVGELPSPPPGDRPWRLQSSP